MWLVELAAEHGHARASIGVEDDLADLRRILASLREPADVAAASTSDSPSTRSFSAA
ncbi:MAG: hypothetical protein QOI78_5631 [Actinomycetota bacterium]|nr:hypothetical protein [Actinomycetota bacterium]